MIEPKETAAPAERTAARLLAPAAERNEQGRWLGRVNVVSGCKTQAFFGRCWGRERA